jgi:hypothetical protein
MFQALAIGAIGVGTGLQMHGAYKAGKEVKAMTEYNAKVAKLQGEAEYAAGVANLEQNIQDSRAMAAMERVAGASRGIDVESGSPLLLAAERAKYRELDQLELLRQANIAKIGAYNQASLLTTQGKNAMSGAWLGMAGTLASGIGTAAAVAAKGGDGKSDSNSSSNSVE